MVLVDVIGAWRPWCNRRVVVDTSLARSGHSNNTRPRGAALIGGTSVERGNATAKPFVAGHEQRVLCEQNTAVPMHSRVPVQAAVQDKVVGVVTVSLPPDVWQQHAQPAMQP